MTFVPEHSIESIYVAAVLSPTSIRAALLPSFLEGGVTGCPVVVCMANTSQKPTAFEQRRPSLDMENGRLPVRVQQPPFVNPPASLTAQVQHLQGASALNDFSSTAFVHGLTGNRWTTSICPWHLHRADSRDKRQRS